MNRHRTPSGTRAMPSKEKGPVISGRGEAVYVLILLLFCVFIFFYRLGDRPLWDIDEGMHAATSKDMVLSGDWVTPTLNGLKFYDKPILYNWLAALSFILFGFSEFAARLPAALLGTGCVLTTYLLGRRMAGPKAGFLGGMILASNVLFIVLSRSVVHDISLVFFVTLALYFFYGAYTGESRRAVNIYLFYASCGLAVLAKGPLGLALPCMVVGLFLLCRKDLGFLKEMKILSGGLIFLAVAAPWYVLVSLRDPNYARFFFIDQNLKRFLSKETLHNQPVYYYLPVIIWGFFPWSCFLPVSFARSFRGGVRNMDRGSLFLLIWFGVMLLFFSVARSKLSTYLLPLFPAMALLAGMAWNDFITAPTRRSRRWFLVSFAPLPAMLAIGLGCLVLFPAFIVEGKYGVPPDRLKLLLFITLLCMCLTMGLMIARRRLAAFGATAGTVGCMIALLFMLILPSVNSYRSSKGIYQKLEKFGSKGLDLVFFKRMKDAILFYSGRKIPVLRFSEELLIFFGSSRRVFCVIEERHMMEIEDDLKGYPIYIVYREGSKLLLSNRP